jgi:hypothetical protein
MNMLQLIMQTLHLQNEKGNLKILDMDVVQEVDHLPENCKALHSKCSTAKKKARKEQNKQATPSPQIIYISFY